MPNTDHPHTPPDAPSHSSSPSSSSALITQHSALTTRRGTPYAASWSPEWIAQVEAVEELLDRRICGARTPTGKPCRMRPTHVLLPSPLGRGAGGEGGENLFSSASPVEGAHDAYSETACHGVADRRSRGRCSFHGGADLAGGQFGNQNAASHGLYTRGLRPCSPSCPLWDKCPLACQDVADLQPPDRPTCPYEMHDYETAVEAYTQMLATPIEEKPKRAKSTAPPQSSALHPRSSLSPHLVELVHRVATLSVMVNRAAAAMREADVIDQTRISSANYSATYARPHAYLQAYLRLSSEFRRYQAMLKEYVPPKPEPKVQSISDLLAELKEQHEAEELLESSKQTTQTMPTDVRDPGGPIAPMDPIASMGPMGPMGPIGPMDSVDPMEPTDLPAHADRPEPPAAPHHAPIVENRRSSSLVLGFP